MKALRKGLPFHGCMAAQGGEYLMRKPVGVQSGIGKIHVEKVAVEGSFGHEFVLRIGSCQQHRCVVDFASDGWTLRQSRRKSRSGPWRLGPTSRVCRSSWHSCDQQLHLGDSRDQDTPLRYQGTTGTEAPSFRWRSSISATTTWKFREQADALAVCAHELSFDPLARTRESWTPNREEPRWLS